jgi:molybdopterin/thiamine biosynthesis adenylyltransferase
MSPAPAIQLTEGRFARLEAIEWWDQALLSRSRVLVIGAGALGNEVIKNLALLGVGHIAIADMDNIELSNLSRSVLFRENDEGSSKAQCAAREAKRICGSVNAMPLSGNILADLGLGFFRWADVVIGALDNREARVFVNSVCARVARAWFDGGIEVLNGIARGFAPPRTACYECTMSKVDWDLLNKRRSCSLLARRAIAQRGTPTTPTTASVIGAIQVQEVIKFLHGLSSMLGHGFLFDGLEHSSYKLTYPINPDCPWHETPAAIESMPQFDSNTPLANIHDEAARRLGGIDALDLSREIVESVECPQCKKARSVFRPAENVSEEEARCPKCTTEGVPGFVHSIAAGSPLLTKTVGELGLPRWDIIWARRGEQMIGFEISGDRPREFTNPDAERQA